VAKSDKPVWKGITFDSEEERELYWWAEEALAAGLIASFAYQSPTFPLFASLVETIPQVGKSGKPIKPKTRQLLKPASYTCDFHFHGISPGVPIPEYVDVKPNYELQDARARIFELKRKWVYQRHNVLVRPVKILELFAATWAPEEAKVTPKKRQLRAGYSKFRTVAEFAASLSAGTSPCEA
jgi:hypothetical protein